MVSEVIRTPVLHLPLTSIKMAQPSRQLDENVRQIRDIMTKKEDYAKDVGEFYDKWAEHYDEDLQNRKYSAPASCAEALSKVLTDKSAIIVDAGAGTGKAGQELAKCGFTRVDAVDISQKCLDIAASTGVYERVICDSLGKNKIKGVEDGYYSGLLAVGVLAVGHVSIDALPEWNRIVRKGGFMVFTISRVTVVGDKTIHEDSENELRGAVTDLIEKGVWELVNKVDIAYYTGHDACMYTIRRL